jgi:hypothetical protein
VGIPAARAPTDSLTLLDVEDDDGRGKEAPMLLMLTVVVTVCFIASLLPFMFPGAVIGLLGKVLNDAIGDPLWHLVPSARRVLVVSPPGGPVLTFEGVLVFYVPLLLALLWLQRRR